jgi:hypothetical protein
MRTFSVLSRSRFQRLFAILPAFAPMNSVCRASFTVLCILACAHSGVPAPLERSVSTSRQFLVYGTDIRLRAAICDLAERTKGDVLRLSDQRDEWTTPIVIHARYPQANLPGTPRAALNFAQTGFGLKLQLDLTIVSDTRQPEVRRELLRAILLEMMYRGQTDLPAGTCYVPPPDWLVDGIAPRQSAFDEQELIGVLRTPLNKRKILPLEDLLRERPDLFDAPGRSLYRAYSFALVELLVRGPDGRHRLARFIAGLPAVANNAMAGLGAYFPELSDANNAEKGWRLHLERLVAGQSFQLLGAKETEQKLAELLVVRICGAGPERNYRLEEFPKFIRDASSKLALARCSSDLRTLRARANPVYCPLIYEFEKVATLLARGKTNRVVERLIRLNATRDGIAARAQKIDDYMNWFEATKPREPSGAFADYLKAAKLMSQPERRRRDPMSVYLDVLEAQFQN